MKTNRRKHSAEFKAAVALAALREQESIPEIARRYKVHANVIYKWKRQLSENVSRAFDAEGPRSIECPACKNLASRSSR